MDRIDFDSPPLERGEAIKEGERILREEKRRPKGRAGRKGRRRNRHGGGGGEESSKESDDEIGGEVDLEA